jgi:hypothetical protein
MTNPDLTLIAALLDRSGSMESCSAATEKGRSVDWWGERFRPREQRC